MITNQSSEALEFLESLIGKKPTFGEHLLAIRQGEEMTQAAFSKQLGGSRHYLCDIEHNRRYVSPKAAAEFAEKLGNSSK
jgi:transcriptional regulator with XRE-family HTH domain